MSLELRRPPRDDVAVYRIRVDLDHAEPPIWRRLDLRSDLPLDVVHQVLQVAFDWTDSHLHRFSLGGSPFDPTSLLFLCPFDVEEGEDDGTPAVDVRLDETLQEPGDAMAYVYDYGDAWELTLRLEDVLPLLDDTPPATAVDGSRAAPPDDSGGGTDLASIAKVVDDPARFDLDGLNEALRAPHFLLRQSGLNQALIDLVTRLRYTPVGHDLGQRALTLVNEPAEPVEEMLEALAGYRWFLDRAKDGGIELTSAGYLKPADVEAASHVVPVMGDWVGSNTREVHALPLLMFRQSLQSIGLLRKHKGTLLLTRAGVAAQRDPAELWGHLADRLVAPKADDFETDVTLLVLACAATSPNRAVPLDEVAAALFELGWRHRDGRPLEGYELNRLQVLDTLANVADKPTKHGSRNWVSPAAAALARAALRRPTTS